MGILLGLPMKLFHIAFVLLRFLWPLLVLWLLRRLYVALRRRREQGGTSRGPEFHGPVYTVDYQDVDGSEKEKEE